MGSPERRNRAVLVLSSLGIVFLWNCEGLGAACTAEGAARNDAPINVGVYPVNWDKEELRAEVTIQGLRLGPDVNPLLLPGFAARSKPQIPEFP